MATRDAPIRAIVTRCGEASLTIIAAPAMLTVVEIAAAVHMCMRDGTYGSLL